MILGYQKGAQNQGRERSMQKVNLVVIALLIALPLFAQEVPPPEDLAEIAEGVVGNDDLCSEEIHALLRTRAVMDESLSKVDWADRFYVAACGFQSTSEALVASLSMQETLLRGMVVVPAAICTQLKGGVLEAGLRGDAKEARTLLAGLKELCTSIEAQAERMSAVARKEESEPY